MAIDYTSNSGRCRMLTGDNNETYLICSDSEITAALALAGDNVFSAAAILCRSIAAKAARNAISVSVLAGNVAIDKTSVPKYMLTLADKYEEMASMADTGDYFVDFFRLKVDPIDGRDDSDYSTSDDDGDEKYFDVHSDYDE